MSEKAERATYVLVADLFFRSKIRAVADAVGVSLQFVRSFAELQKQITAATLPVQIVVDLSDHSLRALEFLPELAKTPQVVGLFGFLGHVEVATMTEARAAGCTVLPRSQFVEKLPAILLGTFTDKSYS